MSAAKPVVASMNLDGDAAELINKAKPGYVVEAGNSKKLADIIIDLFNNPQKRILLGNNGRNYIKKKLSITLAANKYIKIFERIDRSYRSKRKL